jgi:hypothetical protein
MSTKFIRITRWHPRRFEYLPGDKVNTPQWIECQADTTQEVLIKLGDIRLVENVAVANHTIVQTGGRLSFGSEEARSVAKITLTDGQQLFTKDTFEIVSNKIENRYGHIYR